MIEDGRPGRPTAQEARHALDLDILGETPASGPVPELFGGQIAASGTAPVVVTEREAPPRRGPRTPRVKPERVGILFVHGVGSQQRGDTLREFGTPLVDWLEEWHRSRGLKDRFRVTWADLDPPDSTQPAAATVAIPRYVDAAGRTHKESSWVIAEAWWASRVVDPPYPTMLNWLGRRFTSLGAGLRRGSWAAAGRAYRALRRRRATSFIAVALHLVNAVVFGLLYAAVQLLGTLGLGLLGLLALLPIPGLNDFILTKAVRPVLVNNLGDFYVSVYDRIQAVNIRLSVFRAIDWLVEVRDCDRILVAAHSGGTVVILDALGTRDVETPKWRRGLKHVKTLVTFGAALNNAWREGERTDEFRPARTIPERPRMSARWLDFWSDFDWATSGRPLTRGPARAGSHGSIHVTNGLSPVNDHGGYLSNYEEFYARIAQEADRPGHPGRSRFWAGSKGSVDRYRRRRRRVTMLTGWRAAAILTAASAFVGRWALGGRPIEDGAALWALTSYVPVMGGVLRWIDEQGRLALGAAPGIAVAFGAARDVVVWLIALGAVAAVVVLVYAVWVQAFYATWNEKMSLRSARPDAQLPRIGREIAVRSAGFLGLLLLVTIALYAIPPYRTLVALLPAP